MSVLYTSISVFVTSNGNFRFIDVQFISVVRLIRSLYIIWSLLSRKRCESFGSNNAPSRASVTRLLDKFEITGSVVDKKATHQRNIRSPANIVIMQDSVQVSSHKFVRRRSQQLGMSRSSAHRILKNKFYLYPYKIQLTQMLKPTKFAEWILSQPDANFTSRIIFSDETHFHFQGILISKTVVFGGQKKNQMHPERCTVRCGFGQEVYIIWPYFFEN